MQPISPQGLRRAACLPTVLTLIATARQLAAAEAANSAPKPKEPDVICVPTPQPVVDKMLELAEVLSRPWDHARSCATDKP